MAARSRIFYDANNPVMLRPEEIVRLSPSDVQAASDQIDQNMVLLLQRIEENFDKCNQVVTERILPAVQQHGENSRRIYESIKFWRPFFERAAKTKLGEPYMYDEESSSQQGEALAPSGSADQSISFEEGASGDRTVTSEEGTPRPTKAVPGAGVDGQGRNTAAAPSSEEMSPFQALQADLKQIRPGGGASNSGVEQLAGGTQRLRLGDLPPDSPDVPVPDWEIATAGTKSVTERLLEAPSPSLSSIAYETSPPETLRKKKQVSSKQTTASPARLTSAASSQHHPALLERILRKNLAPPGAPSSSTPGRSNTTKLARPAEVTRDWNGLVDLSNTSLSAFASPIKKQGDAADESGWDAPIVDRGASKTSSPVSLPNRSLASLNFSPAPSRTPAKEAAKRMTNDVYSAMGDSPIEPPSVMKEYTARLFGADHAPAPSPSEGMRKGFEEEAFAEEGDSLDLSNRLTTGTTELGKGTLLAEFGGGTTARIDDLLNDNSFAHIVDDGDDFATQHVGSLQDESFTDDVPTNGSRGGLGSAGGAFALHGQNVHDGELDFDEGVSRDAIRNLDGPEDTLFGMKAGARPGAVRQPNPANLSTNLMGEEDSFADGMGVTRNFRMMGPDNLDTLHGGVLLESEPFESSPLAGRDRKDY